MRMHGWAGAILALLILVPMDVQAETASLLSQAQSLLDRGRSRDAVTLLKTGIVQDPDSMVLRYLLAKAYIVDNNHFWALRTLADLAERLPEDGEPLLWSASIRLGQGDLEGARDDLEAAECPIGSPAQTRWYLFSAMTALHAGQRDVARGHLDQAYRASQIFKEDQVVLDRLMGQLDPGFQTPLSGRLELSLGWASNARAGSVTDFATQGNDDSSLVGQFTTWLRFVAPTGRVLRPSLEVDARVLGYLSDRARDASYLLTGLRPGILIGDGPANALVAYRFEALLLAGGDRYDQGPIWFHAAHRVELDATILPQFSVFAGVGKRDFRESGRSRIEVDGGLGGSVSIRPWWRLLGALSLRWHGAEKDPYDLFGGTLLASSEWRIPGDWAARTGLLIGLERYPRSAGYFDALAPDTTRRDTLFKVSVSLFAPDFWGCRAGLTYEFAERLSTTDPYDYRDHRILLKLSWRFAADPWAPAAVNPLGHVALEDETTTSDFGDRIQDLLRQDEAAQRSSSCVE